jgi:hypothetical protein
MIQAVSLPRETACLQALHEKAEWRALAWLLERSDPTNFGRQVIKHTGPNGIALQIQKNLPADHNHLAR